MIAPATHDFDAQLMARVRDGEIELFEQLVSRYQSRVSCLINHMLPGGAEVDDLTQCVFIKVFQARESYTPSAKFSTWLFLITRNVVLNERRRLANRREVSWDTIEPERLCDHRLASRRGTHDPVQELIRRETQREVQSAIEALGLRQQQVIRLAYYNGCCYRAVGEILDVSEKAVKSLVHRAKQNLKLQLQARPSCGISCRNHPH